MGREAHCLSCGQSLARHAIRCPHCGLAQPHRRLGSTVGLALLLGLLGLALAWWLLAGTR